MLPLEFLESMQRLLGDEYEAFLNALKGGEVASLRINALKRGALEAAAPYIDSGVPWEESGYYIKEGTQPGASLSHAAGAFYIQDASAMAPVATLRPRPGEAVLDLCAAPGGKSSQIASYLQGAGVLVANEYVKSRAVILKGNLERMGVKNAIVTSSPAERFAANGAQFDAVLVDTPCSGEGMFRKDPEAAEQWSVDAPRFCHERQLKILDAAAETLKAGGRMVYSTCTFNEIENEGTISAFLSAHPEFEPVDFTLNGIGESKNGCLRLYPHKIRGEGHFVCLMRKRDGKDAPEIRPLKQDKAAHDAARELEKLCLNELPDGIFTLRNDELILQSPLTPRLDGVFILSGGLSLATIKGKTIEPAHALAMSLEPNQAKRHVELSREQAILYMQGETLQNPHADDGWTLVTHQGLPLGWAKQSQGQLKNHLPKGLRQRGGHTLKG